MTSNSEKSEDQATEPSPEETEEQADDSSLEDDFEELKEDYEELESQLKRTHADFQNYKKRVERRQDQREQQAIQSLVEDLLPYLDNQELALNEAEDYESLQESVELNHDQLLTILDDHGFESIDTDTSFDPTKHEATLTKTTHDKEKHNDVVDELRKGYKLGDTVLRHAQVTIAQHEPRQSKEETNE